MAMNYTEDQITEKAIKVLSDLNPNYFRAESLDGINYSVDRNIWIICIYDSIFDASDFLTISDETGEPLYYQNFNMIKAEIIKGPDGIYTGRK